jgi:phage portal protein BeeE
MKMPWTKEPSLPPAVIQEAVDDMAALLNGSTVADRIEEAIKKSIDVAHLQHVMDGNDEGGYFNQEFDLRQTAGKLKALYTREPWVFATSQLIARTLSQIPYLVKDLQGNILETHPLMEQINAGSALQDGRHRDWSGYLDLTLGGNYFLVFDEDYETAFHIPVEMVNLKMRETDDAEELERLGMIESLQIMEHGGFHPLPQKVFPWEQVVHFRMPNPYNPFYGLSMYSAAARPIMLDRHKNEFEMAFYLRGATNAGVIETSEEISRTRMDRLMKTFEKAFTGRRNWWRTLFLPKGAKWVNSGLTQSEMQHLEGLRENRLTLLAVLGIPPSQVGIVQDVNRATAETQEAQMWNNTIIPMSWFTASGWNSSYLVRQIYGGEVVVEPDLRGIDAVEGSLLSRSEQAKAADNILTINEQREIVGYAPLKETDPRGNMFLTELQKTGLGFGTDAPAPVADDDLGPDVDNLGMTEGNTGDGTGTYRHSHPAKWDKETGNGETMGTQGDGPEHSHQIENFKVLAGGEDEHTHADLKGADGEKAAIARAKSNTVTRQRKLERLQQRKFNRGLKAYFSLLFTQVKEAAEKGVSVQAHLDTLAIERQDHYAKNVLPVLDQTLDKGFELAQSTTKSLSNTLWIMRRGFNPTGKTFRFTETDEQAIAAIRETTEEGNRTRLTERGISRFLGFDQLATSNIMQIIEDNLAEGKGELETARQIELKYSERYTSQFNTIARTEVLSAISAGQKWQQDVLDQVFTKTMKQWFHVGDSATNPDARQEHKGFEKEGEVPSDHVYHNPVTGNNLKYPRDPAGGADDVINCRCSITTVIPEDAQSNASEIIG